MKQASEVSRMIKEIIDQPRVDELTKEKLKKSALDKMRKTIRFLQLCRNYLETKPSEEFCRKELDKLTTQLEIIDGRYPQDKTFGTIAMEKEFKKEFNKRWEVLKIKEQIKTLKLILK